jgi:FAD/FMN-containing dehydrogenase
LVKDNSGYDWPGLLCGSEGTLAVVTEARLGLVPLAPHRVAALVGLASLEAALVLLRGLRRLASLEACEVMFADGVEIVCARAGLRPPFAQRHSCLVVVECAGQSDPSDELAEALATTADLSATAVASDTAGRAELWSWRERHTEAVNGLGIPHKLDVTLPLGRLAAFEAEVRLAITAAAPRSTTVIWGHLGDGNLHVNVVGPPADDDRVDEVVLQLVAANGGSISAEHGIGSAKRKWLHLTRSEADLAAMGSIKRALDPRGLLNPNVLFSDPPPWEVAVGAH